MPLQGKISVSHSTGGLDATPHLHGHCQKAAAGEGWTSPPWQLYTLIS